MSEVTFSHIVAMSKNHVIGVNGDLPWHLSDDLKRFKKITMGHMLVMGRKTYESIGRPLPGRKTIVVSRRKDVAYPEGVEVFSSIDEALEFCRQPDQVSRWGHEAFIVGGGQIYQQTLERIDKIYLTRVEQEVEGDTLYPDVSQQFSLSEEERHLASPIPYSTFICTRT